MKRILIFLVSIFVFDASIASPLTLTTSVESVTVIARPGVDYGGLLISVSSPITGTSCADADLEKGFYVSSGANAGSVQIAQMYQSQALFASAQSLKITVHYDSYSGCQPGWGVYFTQIAVESP